MKRIALYLSLVGSAVTLASDPAEAQWGRGGGFNPPGNFVPVYPQPGYPQPGYPQPGFRQPGFPMQGGGFINRGSEIAVDRYTDVRVQRPGLAVLGGVMQGIASGLHADDANRHRTAIGIMNGIGNGALLGAQPSIRSGGRIRATENGQFGFFGRP